MSQSTLIKKIKADAMETVAEIKTAGVSQVEAVQRETDNAIAVLKQEYEGALKKKLDNMELVSLSKAKQEARMTIQNTKRNQVNKLFSEVTTKYIELPSEEYIAFFKKHLNESFPSNVKIISVSAPTKRTAETKEIVKDFGYEGEISSDAQFEAGLVVKAEDGVYDITLERMMSDKKADFETRIMQEIV